MAMLGKIVLPSDLTFAFPQAGPQARQFVTSCG